MTREQLEHLIRASDEITQDDLVVVGSQAILAAHPNAPDPLLHSQEADMYPRAHPERAAVIDGSIGEGSIFQDTLGYCAHGVGPETVVAPEGWQDRLIALGNQNTGRTTGWCLHPLDLAVAKLIAGRQKDWDFVIEMLKAGIVTPDELRRHAASLEDSQRPTEAVDGCLARANAR